MTFVLSRAGDINVSTTDVLQWQCSQNKKMGGETSLTQIFLHPPNIETTSLLLFSCFLITGQEAEACHLRISMQKQQKN